MGLPRENVYRCEYGCNTVTVDVDRGVTPFMIKCKSVSRPGRPLMPSLTGPDGECVGTAHSSFYPGAPRPPHLPAPTHEWFRPSELAGLSDDDADHVRRGGLLLRPRTAADPIYHGEQAAS